MVALRTRVGQIRVAGIAEYLLSLFLAAINAIVGPFILAFKIQWGTIPRTGGSNYVIAIGRGLLITLPLLVLFAGLLMGQVNDEAADVPTDEVSNIDKLVAKTGVNADAMREPFAFVAATSSGADCAVSSCDGAEDEASAFVRHDFADRTKD